ncbi:MAG TPA: rod shape-determining protein MreC [Edaphobacter sp.]|uniref:rod shape-determining protein MreC n=1 Tax=Edaphobacter sp. TaxID=1934404 RepID=UPI002B9633E6|nr:rod shape-determining protein MreC [Edaphobacter sp.]HUZ96143.1 rod shape-determining protein MreC [Edaphobacter sp.]
MESFFTRFKNVLVLVAVLLAQTIGLAIQVRRPIESGAPDSHDVTLMRYWVVAGVTPFERFFHFIGFDTRDAWSNYVNLRDVRQQNRDLQQQIARLRIEQAAFAEDAIQGHRLQALLAFQQHYIASTVAAQVIGTSGSDLSHVLYIDKGADFHLRPDMAVITPDGIVGKIRDVFPHTSQVLLISDTTSGAGVVLSSTRILAILHGSPNGQVQINNLTADSRIKPGETVLTSGGDQIFPRGLPVGTIESIAPDPDHQPYTVIRIKPAANLSQLEEVLVITGTQSTLPVAAQKDLAIGASTAERQAAAAAIKAKAAADAEAAAEASARSAAEVMADRLPSLPAPPPVAPGTTAPAATATPSIPHPLPTIHPDRYTPGDTPPAADLTPGAKSTYRSTAVPTPASPDNTPRDGQQKSPKTPQNSNSATPQD